MCIRDRPTPCPPRKPPPPACRTRLPQVRELGPDYAGALRHDQVPERDLRAVAAAVGLGEQGRQFLVCVDVRDLGGGPGQRACGQDVSLQASATQPTGQLPDRAVRPCRVAGLTPRRRADATHASTETGVTAPSPGNSPRQNASNRTSTRASVAYL